MVDLLRYNEGMSTDNLTSGIQLFDMNISVLTGIVLVALLLLGMILLIFGIARNKIFIQALGAGIIGSVCIYLFVESSQFRDILVALASIFAVVIAVLSLYQTQRIRKDSLDKEDRDRKEHLLNEIIEWAIDMGKCGIEVSLDSWRHISSLKELELEDFINISELVGSFSSMRSESHYISKISSAFGQSLQDAVIRLKDSLEEHIDLLDRWQKVFIEPGKEKNLKQDSLDDIDKLIINHKKQLRLLARTVIEEATNIKTAGIS